MLAIAILGGIAGLEIGEGRAWQRREDVRLREQRLMEAQAVALSNFERQRIELRRWAEEIKRRSWAVSNGYLTPQSAQIRQFEIIRDACRGSMGKSKSDAAQSAEQRRNLKAAAGR